MFNKIIGISSNIPSKEVSGNQLPQKILNNWEGNISQVFCLLHVLHIFSFIDALPRVIPNT